jgi:hypothetical protein
MEEEDLVINYSNEAILIGNLKLLEYTTFVEEFDYAVPLEPTLFRKSNTKAMESILYFLLYNLVGVE